MKTLSRTLAFVVATASLSSVAFASKIVLTAQIDGSQEVPATTSPATGHAVMKYDTTTNTFDLTVTLRSFSETVTNSHFHQAPVGVSGGVVHGIGGEGVYTRHQNNLKLSLKDQVYLGDPAALLTGGVYLNFHTATFPPGAIRGQLLVQNAIVTLRATINGSQEVPSNDSEAFGTAVMHYNVVDNTFDLVINLHKFSQTLTNSHFHEAPVGVSGGVVHGIGGAAVYQRNGKNLRLHLKDQVYLGDPITLLTGGTYLNFHTPAIPAGEIRGQLYSDL